MDELRWRKASFSGSTDCAEVAVVPAEKVSSFSAGGGACVDRTATGEDAIAVRSTITGDTVMFNRREMDAFIKGAKAGEFDEFC